MQSKNFEKIKSSKQRLECNETDERRERSNKRNKPQRKRFNWEE
ncbi:hypothetical protein EPNKCIFM_00186 [Klebsiella phage KP13-16]|nr:hypothetical protein EPNKCIFM_00186 [Klebsiella phage KP13-16]